jgi:hypothetical protein
MTLGHLLGRSSVELANSVRACTELQWVISRLLEKSDHPDLVTEMHVLQDIDRLQQTLADLACLLETSASALPEQVFDASSALQAMRLPSLRDRMFDLVATPATQGDTTDSSNDITWL